MMKIIFLGVILCFLAYNYYSISSKEAELNTFIVGEWVSEEMTKFGGAMFETKETNYFYESGKGVVIMDGKMSFDLPNSKLNKATLLPVNMSSNTHFEWSLASNILYTTNTYYKSVGNDLPSKMKLAKIKLKKNKEEQSLEDDFSTQTQYIHVINEDQIELRMNNKYVQLRRSK